MRLFITGATGVIGIRVVPQLVAAGHHVVTVGRSSAKREALQRLGAEPVAVDLFDAAAVRRAVRGMDAIVNLATAVPASAAGALLPGAWRQMDRIRRQVSAHLVDAALAGDTVTCLVQEAFAPIYADSGDHWIDESSPIQPARYNRSVLDAESQAERFTRAGRRGVVLRFGGFYGPGDAFSLQFVDAVRRGWFPLFGRPEGYSSWITQADAAAAVVAALRVPAGIYNVVEDAPMRRRELADGLAQLLGVKPPRFLPNFLVHLTGSVGETLARSLRISNGKLRRASDWVPQSPTTLDGYREILAQLGHAQPPLASAAVG